MVQVRHQNKLKASTKELPLELLLNLFSPKIIIETNEDYFVFQKGEKIINIQTYIYVYHDKGNYKVLSVGSEPTGSQMSHKIKLFEKGNHNFYNLKKTDLLQDFIQFALKELIPKTSIVRPTLIFKIIGAFDKIFHGCQEAVFRVAAVNSGAADVQFEK